MATARDGCVVETEPLAFLLRTFVENWTRTRPSTAGQFTSPRDAASPRPLTMGAVEWLATQTHISPSTIENIVGRRPRYRVTELRIADPLVAAIGRPDAFHDGTLTVSPNPLAERTAREACCSSVEPLTGSGARAPAPPLSRIQGGHRPSPRPTRSR